MTKVNEPGLANIPILIAIALILAITPLALKLVQNNQNLQNKATSETACLPVGKANCFQIPCCNGLSCQNGSCIAPAASRLPCNVLVQAQSAYCNPKIGVIVENSGPTGKTPTPVKQPAVPCGQITAAIAQYCRPAAPAIQ